MSDKRLACGVDVGGTKILGGVVDEDGVIVEELRVVSPATDTEAIENAIEAAGHPAQVAPRDHRGRRRRRRLHRQGPVDSDVRAQHRLAGGEPQG